MREYQHQPSTLSVINRMLGTDRGLVAGTEESVDEREELIGAGYVVGEGPIPWTPASAEKTDLDLACPKLPQKLWAVIL